MILECYDGTKIDFDVLYPKEKRLKVNHTDEYYEGDDGLYDDLISEEDKKKYGIC